MTDEVLAHTAALIERSVSRAREEYAAAGEHFDTDYTRQDAAVLNIQRAWAKRRSTWGSTWSGARARTAPEST